MHLTLRVPEAPGANELKKKEEDMSSRERSPRAYHIESGHFVVLREELLALRLENDLGFVLDEALFGFRERLDEWQRSEDLYKRRPPARSA